MKPAKTISKGAIWTSYILQGLLTVMFLLGAFTNLLQTEMAVAGAVEMGYPASSVLYLGIVLLVSAILFAIPRTTFFGGLLITGWLGGAVGTHVIHAAPLTLTVAPVIFGVLVWLSIWQRNEKLRAIVGGK